VADNVMLVLHMSSPVYLLLQTRAVSTFTTNTQRLCLYIRCKKLIE